MRARRPLGIGVDEFGDLRQALGDRRRLAELIIGGASDVIAAIVRGFRTSAPEIVHLEHETDMDSEPVVKLINVVERAFVTKVWLGRKRKGDAIANDVAHDKRNDKVNVYVFAVDVHILGTRKNQRQFFLSKGPTQAEEWRAAFQVNLNLSCALRREAAFLKSLPQRFTRAERRVQCHVSRRSRCHFVRNHSLRSVPVVFFVE